MKKTLLFTLFFAALTLTVSAGEIYDSAYPIEHNAARVVKDLKWGLLNEKLEEVLAPKWDYLGELSENLRMVRAGTLSGFADAGGKQVIAPQFSQAMNFSEGLACVKNESGKWGYINTSGSLVIPYLYDEANSFSSGLALIKQNGLYGYIDADNNPVIPPTYQEAYPFYEGRACVKVEDKYGYIDTNGVMVIKPEFSLAFDFSEGAAVIKTEKYGLIDSGGSVLIPPQWEHLSSTVKNGYLKATKDGKLGFIDTAGYPKTQFVFTYLGDFSEGFCVAASEEGYGFLNSRFILEIPMVWENAGSFSNGLAPVQKNGLWGYTDSVGQLIVDYQYQEAGAVSCGYAPVCLQQGGYQFIPVDSIPDLAPQPPAQQAPVAQPTVQQNPVPQNTSQEKAETSSLIILQINHPFMYTPKGTVLLTVLPVVHQGHTMIPIRMVAETMGATVSWNEQSKIITIKKEGSEVSMKQGSSVATVNGKTVPLSAPPILQNGSTLCPLRFVAESLGATVSWDTETKRIVIAY